MKKFFFDFWNNFFKFINVWEILEKCEKKFSIIFKIIFELQKNLDSPPIFRMFEKNWNLEKKFFLVFFLEIVKSLKLSNIYRSQKIFSQRFSKFWDFQNFSEIKKFFSIAIFFFWFYKVSNFIPLFTNFLKFPPQKFEKPKSRPAALPQPPLDKTSSSPARRRHWSHESFRSVAPEADTWDADSGELSTSHWSSLWGKSQGKWAENNW